VIKYSRLRLTAYNEKPNEEGAFYCDAEIDEQDIRFDRMLKHISEPMFAVVHGKMIPEMPNPSVDGLVALMEWESKYFHATEPG
jgi:hypothetical protein